MDNAKILLIDDDSDHQQLVLLALRKSKPDVDVVSVTTRWQFLEALRREEYDCIVLDFNLPPFTAPELIREIEDEQPEIPRIVISSSEEQRVVVESLRHGVADFVHKADAVCGDILWRRVEEAIEIAQVKHRERRRLNRRLKVLQRQAETDPLTGLSNRRFTERMLNGEPRQTDRRALTALIMVDLDRFKSVNDTLGHAAGDALLKDVADLIRSKVMPTDTVARWGGEEFLIIRQSETLADAWVWSDNLRRAITSDIRIDDPVRAVTASIGVAVLPTNSLCEDSVTQADHAMYLAKESGRNRVCTWPMVVAIDAASDAQMHAELPARKRLELVIDSLRDSLGTVQLEHVGEHGVAVRNVCEQIANIMLDDPDEREDLLLAAEFHDIGKIALTERVLALPRALTEGERRFVDQHARIGAEILHACGVNNRASATVEFHHTRFDSSSPTQVQDELHPPLESILSACDAFVAMLSNRPYASSRTRAQAIAELKQERGQQFHPDVVDAIQSMEESELLQI